MMMMNKAYTKNNNQRRILLTLTSLIFLAISCNLPFLSGGGSAEENLETNLQASGLLFVDQITVSEDLVTIEYQVLPEDDQEVLVAGWLNALLAAYETQPDAAQYQLLTHLDGEPYLEVRAEKLDLEGFAEGTIDLDLFLERLVITDQRPTVDRAWDALVPLGLTVVDITENGTSLIVAYWAEPAADQAALIDEWWQIFAGLLDLDGSHDQIEIQAIMPDNSSFRVSGELDSLRAYAIGEITAVTFLASLSISEEIAGSVD